MCIPCLSVAMMESQVCFMVLVLKKVHTQAICYPFPSPVPQLLLFLNLHLSLPFFRNAEKSTA